MKFEGGKSMVALDALQVDVKTLEDVTESFKEVGRVVNECTTWAMRSAVRVKHYMDLIEKRPATVSVFRLNERIRLQEWTA